VLCSRLQLRSPLVRWLIGATFKLHFEVAGSSYRIGVMGNEWTNSTLEVCRVVRSASSLGDALSDAITLQCKDSSRFLVGSALDTALPCSKVIGISQSGVESEVLLEKNVLYVVEACAGVGGGEIHAGDQFMGNVGAGGLLELHVREVHLKATRQAMKEKMMTFCTKAPKWISKLFNISGIKLVVGNAAGQPLDPLQEFTASNNQLTSINTTLLFMVN
jgi:hypothetical protein